MMQRVVTGVGAFAGILLEVLVGASFGVQKSVPAGDLLGAVVGILVGIMVGPQSRSCYVSLCFSL